MSTPEQSSGVGAILSKLLSPASNFLQYGTVIPSAAAKAYRAATAAAAQAAAEKQTGKELLAATLAGLGTGAVLTRAHHVISDMNTPKQKYTKFVPGPKALDDEEKLAGAGMSASDLMNKVISAPGKFVSQFPASDSSAVVDQSAVKTLMLLTGAGGGLYGGHKLMQQLAEKKKKEDVDLMVEDAKKEYQRALIGKRASADLDEAFGVIEKRAGGNNLALNLADNVARGLFYPIKATGLNEEYVAANALLGALSGKMVYDWTRERSKDKALAEAQKARARLAGAPSIYIDPDQLAKVKAIAR